MEERIPMFCHDCNEEMILFLPIDLELDDNIKNLFRELQVEKFVIFRCEKCNKNDFQILSVSPSSSLLKIGSDK